MGAAVRHWDEDGKPSESGSWSRRAAVAVGNVDLVEAMAVLREMVLERCCQDSCFDGKGQLGWVASVNAFFGGKRLLPVGRLIRTWARDPLNLTP